MKNKKIALIGLGYVGLPLAVEFGMNREVIGFDINQKRISDLKNGIDSTLEVDESKLKSSSGLFLSNNENDLALCNILIVTVPTPIDENNNPNLNLASYTQIPLITESVREKYKYSNKHGFKLPLLFLQNLGILCFSKMIISPGSTSRTNKYPNASITFDSLATI